MIIRSKNCWSDFLSHIKVKAKFWNTFFTPSLTKIVAIFMISSVVSKWEFGVRVIPSSGMQYWHLKLHLEKSDTSNESASHRLIFTSQKWKFLDSRALGHDGRSESERRGGMFLVWFCPTFDGLSDPCQFPMLRFGDLGQVGCWVAYKDSPRFPLTSWSQLPSSPFLRKQLESLSWTLAV